MSDPWELSPEWLNDHQGRITWHEEGGAYLAVAFPYLAWIYDQTVKVIDTRDEIVACERVIRSFGEKFYANIEGFVRYCGDGARAATVTMDGGIGDIIYIYDNREEKVITHFPDGTAVDAEDLGGYSEGGNFCYALNVNDEWCSEWGYCGWLPLYGETMEQAIVRTGIQTEAMMDWLKPDFIVTGSSVVSISMAPS